MIHKRQNPIGIDTEIQRIQSHLYDVLTSLWVNNLSGFGRIYKDVHDESDLLRPYWYVGDREYKDVYFDDKYAGSFFFVTGDEPLSEDEFKFRVDVKCVFMVNLEEIFSEEQDDRADQKAQRDVIHALRDISHGAFSVSGISVGLDNVLVGLDTSQIHFTDQHPLHCFSINIDLSYYFDSECDITSYEV